MSTTKSKHAFGSEANVDAAIQNGLIDAYDIMFLDEKKIGWVDRDGNKVIIDHPDTATLEAEIANKANADEVEARIDQVQQDVVAAANAYADAQIKAAVEELRSVAIVEF